MKKVIDINGTKIRSIVLRPENIGTEGAFISLTIHPNPGANQLELTAGMTAMLANAGITGRLTKKLSPENRKHDLHIHHYQDGSVTISQIPQHRSTAILAKILAGMQTAKLLSQAEEYAAEQKAGLILESSEFTTRMANELEGRIQSIAIQTPRTPGESDRSNIIIRFRPFTPDSDDYQNARQGITDACKAIMPEGSEKLYLIKSSPLAENPTFTIAGIPTEGVDVAAKTVVQSLLDAGLLQQKCSVNVYKALALMHLKRPPSSGPDRPR